MSDAETATKRQYRKIPTPAEFLRIHGQESVSKAVPEFEVWEKKFLSPPAQGSRCKNTAEARNGLTVKQQICP
jgi:hypothetical protein